jgi:phenazine biosynthesis protein phzE
VKWEEKIISIIVNEKKEFNFEDFSDTFEEKESVLEWELKEHFSETEYKEMVKTILEKEIRNGEGANFLVAQKIEWKIENFDIEVGLSIFKRLLEWDYWTYLHFIFFDWEKLFIWASPEKNVSVDNNNRVRMNPISGTFKKIWYINYLNFRWDFLDFLKDKKEINELFMATDEELKMMSQICSSWGIIVWPILKEMANLIHTEYLLSWKSSLSKIDILRKSMWASTVIWSPIESAFRVVSKYENFSRKYYAWAICHITEDSLDSAIMIRTLQLDIYWKLDLYVWASLVKDSNPQKEYEELKIKMKWVLNAIKWISKPTRKFIWDFYLDDEIQELIQLRNQNLSKTWFFKQENQINKKLVNKKCLIVNNEDDFTNMLAHLLKLLWLKVEIKRFDEINIKKENYDLFLIWPWPWNPIENTEKNLTNLEIIKFLKQNNKPYFWICLGHQLICRSENIELKKKEISTQWEQIEIDLFWKKEKVAFYNTFSWINKNWEEINSLESKKYFSFQFHPESILTQNWLEILEKSLEGLIGENT